MTDESAFVCMNVDDCERLIDESVFNVWQDRWNVCEKGRLMYGFIQNMRFVTEIEMYAWYVLLTGLGSMNDFLYMCGLAESPSCKYGTEKEDCKHVLYECKLYDEFRNVDAIGVKVDMNGEVDMSDVLAKDERYERLC